MSVIRLEAPRGDPTLDELFARRGVHANQIGTWRKQPLDRTGEVFKDGNPAA